MSAWALVSLPGWMFCSSYLWRARIGDGISRFTLFDDAMISMSYARTLAKTGELVWFPGADRVQGFTNPLWTFVMALVHLLLPSGQASVLGIQLIGFLLLTFTSLLISRGLRFLGVSSWLAHTCSGCTYFLFPLVFWTLEGMEVGLLGLLLLGLVFWAGHGQYRENQAQPEIRFFFGWSLMVFIGVAVRVDFVVPALAIGLVLFVDSTKRMQKAPWGNLILPLAPLVSALVVVACQKSYYGDWLPNTYHLKMDGVALTTRLRRGFLSFASFLPVAILIGSLCSRVTRNRVIDDRQRRTLSSGIAAFTAVVLYSVWVGGDAWEGTLIMNRFLAVALPSALVCLAIALHAGERGRSSVSWVGLPLWVIVPAITALVLLAGIKVFLSRVVFAPSHSLLIGSIVMSFLLLRPIVERRSDAVSDRLSPGHASLVIGAFVALVSLGPIAKWVISPDAYAFHRPSDVNASELGLFLARTTDASTTLGVTWAGNPVYWSERAAVDLLGKSDRVVARIEPIGSFWPGHDKFDFNHSVIDLQPDIIVQGGILFPKGDLRSAGYVERCIKDRRVVWNVLWIRSDFEGIDQSSISVCPTD